MGASRPVDFCKQQSIATIIALGIFISVISPIAMRAQSPTVSSAKFEFKEDGDKSLKLWEGDQPVLVYHHRDVTFKAGRRARSRASYVHPIYGLDGEILTDDFPADHYHHHGLFWCWPHVKVGEREYDFWERDDIRITFRRWLARETGNDGAKLGVENGWFAGDKRIMREEAWFGVYPASADGRNIDVSLTWTPLDEAVTLSGAEGKSYGGLSLRFAPRRGTVITVPGGRAAEDLLITKLPWANLSAQFENAPHTSGAAVFVHPSHPDFPPEWMTRDYGLLAVGWPGVSPKTLPAGKPVTCRYRFWIHRGTPDASTIQKQYYIYRSAATRSATAAERAPASSAKE